MALTTRQQHPRHIWLAIPAIWLFFFLALNSMTGDSPTMDEQNHLARGLAFLRTGDPRLSLEHPPLVNAISALPLLTLPDLRLPTDHPSWQRPEGWYEFADLLLWEYNHDVERMIFLARLPIVLLTLGLAVLAYHVARLFWGGWAGLAALTLILFDPNVLGNGRYTTTDLGGTFFLFLATFWLWRLWQSNGWSWPRLLLGGMGLGMAFASKLSTLGFVPILALLALLPLYDSGNAFENNLTQRRRGAEEKEKNQRQSADFRSLWCDSGRRLGQLLVAGLLSIFVVWALFGFEWRNFYFTDEWLVGLNAYQGPMPTFWAGVAQILRFSQSGRGSAFLLGQFSDEGFLAYFPVAFMAKTPLPLLILLPIAVFSLLRQPSRRKKGLFLLIPAVLYFGISTQSALNIGYRHLLPMLPFLWVLISGQWAVVSGQKPSFAIRNSQFGLWGSVVWLIVITLWIHPHYLSYFNELAGGPTNGYNVLVDSNVDWGQDLLRLQDWMAENEVDSVKLAWFGSADPAYYGLAYEPLPGVGRGEFHRLWWAVPFDRTNPEPGVYAISVSNLWELPLRPEEKTVFAWFRDHEPTDRVGYSIMIYDLREMATNETE